MDSEEYGTVSDPDRNDTTDQPYQGGGGTRDGVRYAWRHKTRGLVVSPFLPGSVEERGELNGVIDCYMFRDIFGFMPQPKEVYKICFTYTKEGPKTLTRM